ncbi:MAG: hypothetical protein JWM71_106 [Solirubrobacteraceae bacterium]|nr:hypothetical protein [Solirubrobacteraceae bacterium]
MRGRHFPRLCHVCQAPMARQEATCWHCGAQWQDEPALTHDDPPVEQPVAVPVPA